MSATAVSCVILWFCSEPLWASPPPTVGFASVAFRVNENAGNAYITIQRTTPVSTPVSVNYTVGLPGDTAAAGYDYETAPSGTLFWNPGDPEFQQLVIPIVDDTVAEGPEIFSITLSNPDGAALGIARTTVVIRDNEIAGSEETAGHKLSIKSVTDVGNHWAAGDFAVRMTIHNPSGLPSYPGRVDIVFRNTAQKPAVSSVIATQFFDAVAARSDQVMDIFANVGQFPNGEVFLDVYENVPSGAVFQASAFGGGYVDHHTAPPTGGTLPPDPGKGAPGFIPPSVTLAITGPAQVSENSSGSYHAILSTKSASGTTQDQVNARWVASAFQISGTGILSTGEVSRTTTISINAVVQVNGANFSASLPVTVINIPAPPQITSSLSASSTRGKPFTYRILARHEPTSYGATNLPDGLSINVGTGLISGIPTVAGNSTVTISASNHLGSDSKPLSLSVYEPSPLTVNITGGGTVSPLFASADLRDVGRTYTLLAKAGSGQVFDGWHGDIDSSATKLVFTMRPNLVLEARFIPNPFLASTGQFSGLLSGSNNENTGAIRITVSSNGGFSAKLALGGHSYSTRGAFANDGTVSNLTVHRPGLASLILNLSLDIAGTSQTIRGSLLDGVVSSQVSAGRAIVSPNAGTIHYTFLIPAGGVNPDVPAGTGYGTAAISPSGKVILAGTLADGSHLSAGGSITVGNVWPLFASLFGGKGSISGDVQIAPQGGSDFNGSVTWYRPEQPADVAYAKGWPTGLDLAIDGSIYSAPPVISGLPAAASNSNAHLTFQDGGLGSPVDQLIKMNAAGSVKPDSSVHLPFKIQLNARTGLFFGIFSQGSGNQAQSFGGAIFQKTSGGAGFFRALDHTSGSVSLGLLP